MCAHLQITFFFILKSLYNDNIKWLKSLVSIPDETYQIHVNIQKYFQVVVNRQN